MADPSNPDFEIEVFFDGDCPLCRREINFIRRRDIHRKILLHDIAGLDFSESSPGRTREQLMAEIHGRTPDGTWITGVEVFRRVYSAVGWHWLAALLQLPVIRPLLDIIYPVFARNRLRLTGRVGNCGGIACHPESPCESAGHLPAARYTDVETPR